MHVDNIILRLDCCSMYFAICRTKCTFDGIVYQADLRRGELEHVGIYGDYCLETLPRLRLGKLLNVLLFRSNHV